MVVDFDGPSVHNSSSLLGSRVFQVLESSRFSSLPGSLESSKSSSLLSKTCSQHAQVFGNHHSDFRVLESSEYQSLSSINMLKSLENTTCFRVFPSTI